MKRLLPVASCILITTLPGCQTISTVGQEDYPITVSTAPDPVPVVQTSNSALKQKLANCKTINVFHAWNSKRGNRMYGLYWTARPRSSSTNFALMEIYWNYHYIGKPWSTYPGQEPFITNKKWNHDDEYGKTVWLGYFDPRFPNYFSNLTHQRSKKFGADGLMIDWWHNNHPGDVDKSSVARARHSVAAAVREKMGDEFIILENVNWRKDKSTGKSEVSKR